MLSARISRLCIEGNKLYVAAVHHVHNAMLIFLADHRCEVRGFLVNHSSHYKIFAPYSVLIV
jgi:hypothetical protein